MFNWLDFSFNWRREIVVVIINHHFSWKCNYIFLSKKTFIKKKKQKKREEKPPKKLVYSVYMRSMKITGSIREDYGLWTKGDNYTSMKNDGDVGKSQNLCIYSTDMICLHDVTWRGVMAAYTTTGNSKYSYF
jgi:hypothetical protein